MGQEAMRRISGIPIWAMLLTGVLAAGLPTVAVIQVRRSRSMDPLSNGVAAYRREDFAAAARLARSRLQVEHNDGALCLDLGTLFVLTEFNFGLTLKQITKYQAPLYGVSTPRLPKNCFSAGYTSSLSSIRTPTKRSLCWSRSLKIESNAPDDRR